MQRLPFHDLEGFFIGSWYGKEFFIVFSLLVWCLIWAGDSLASDDENNQSALLNKYRDVSKTEREKGTYFEHLAKDFLKNDPVYEPQFEDVCSYSDLMKH